jgi:hypothetical protein
MDPRQLDEVYTRLCHRLTEAGEEAVPAVLARLVLLLMQEVADPQRIGRAIDEATDGHVPTPSSPR